MLKKTLFFIFCIIIVATLFGAFFGKNKSDLINKTENTNFNNFEISNIKECRVEGGFKAICASVKNNSNKDYKFVQVKIKLFDNNNNIIHNTATSASDLEKGQSWNFSVAVLNEKASSFQIKDIIGIL